MKDIVNKLCADLRERLRKKATRPRKEEIERWAPFRIPFVAPLMASVGFLILCGAGSDYWAHLLGKEVAFTLLGPWAVIAFTIAAFMAWPRLNNMFIKKAYRMLLDSNERFTLYEYSKFLKRKLNASIKDPSLGGVDEVRRLTELQGKIVELLQKGTASKTPVVASTLSDEALVAESVIETFEATQVDTLKSLDDRLPEELRCRLDDLEREFGAETSREELE